MKLFSIPADFKQETIDGLYQLNSSYTDSKVIETYGQLTDGMILNSGRIIDALPKVNLNMLERYVKHSKQRGIEFNYTLNPACMGNFEFSTEGVVEINLLLQQLYNIGIRLLTVTTPSLIELIKASGFKFEIKASAICEITSPSKSLFYKNIGVNRVVVDPDITRDFEKLENICKTFGTGVEIIINNVCMKNCAYKMFHYNHEAHCTNNNPLQLVKDYYFNRCSMQKAGEFKNAIKLNWIRPEDLKHYYNIGISHFKIQGRQNVVQGNILATLQHYFDESFDGNLFDLITIFAPYNAYQPRIDNAKLDGFIDAFLNNPSFCRDMCSSCGYCEKFAYKAMNIESVTELNKKAIEFYRGYDRYTKLVNDKVQDVSTKKLFSENDLNVGFDF